MLGKQGDAQLTPVIVRDAERALGGAALRGAERDGLLVAVEPELPGLHL